MLYFYYLGFFLTHCLPFVAKASSRRPYCRGPVAKASSKRRIFKGIIRRIRDEAFATRPSRRIGDSKLGKDLSSKNEASNISLLNVDVGDVDVDGGGEKKQ